MSVFLTDSSPNSATPEIVGCYIADRSRQSARKLWISLPAVYRQCAVAYTDTEVSYEKVIPRKCH